MYVTSAINLGRPRGAFSLGIPADKIAGDPHYLDATEHQVSQAVGRAVRAIPDDRTFFPIVGEHFTERYTASPVLFNSFRNPVVALCKDGRRLGYAEASAVSDPIFVMKNDGTYKPIAYMVFKEEIKGGSLRTVPVGYRLEDQNYKSQMDDDLYQGPTDKLSRRDDGNWVLRVKTKSADSSSLRHRGKVLEKAIGQRQDAERTGENHDFSEEPDGLDAQSSDESDSQYPGNIIGAFTFRYDSVNDEENILLDSESESESESENVDPVINPGISSRVRPLAAGAVRTELIQGGIPGRGMWTLASMGVLLYIGIMAKLSYDLYNRRTPQAHESNPNFDSTVYNAFEKCAIELGFDLTTGEKNMITSLVKVLKDPFGKKLGAIGDIGGLLECHPDELTRNLGAIYSSFDHQMKAIAATAGLLSPSACLILLSLAFLFTYGAV